MIAGNHSTPRTTSSSPILEVFSVLDNVHAVYKQRYELIEFDKILFHAIPHINDEAIMIEELKKLENNINHDKRNILMMHCSVGSHYLMHEFGEWVYPKEFEYLFEKFDYVALGHWHGFGKVGKFDNVFYAGSTERTSSSDKRVDKGYVEVLLKENLEVTHHDIKLRKSLTFTIDSENLENEINSLKLQDIKDALVEVRLTNLTPTTSIDITNKDIEEIFKDALYVRVIREFKQTKQEHIKASVESVSLEEYFLSHIDKNVEDEFEKDRLSLKAKELFAKYEESCDDTN